jgi:hypothetical protein
VDTAAQLGNIKAAEVMAQIGSALKISEVEILAAKAIGPKSS